MGCAGHTTAARKRAPFVGQQFQNSITFGSIDLIAGEPTVPAEICWAEEPAHSVLRFFSHRVASNGQMYIHDAAAPNELAAGGLVGTAEVTRSLPLETRPSIFHLFTRWTTEINCPFSAKRMLARRRRKPRHRMSMTSARLNAAKCRSSKYGSFITTTPVLCHAVSTTLLVRSFDISWVAHSLESC